MQNRIKEWNKKNRCLKHHQLQESSQVHGRKLYDLWLQVLGQSKHFKLGKEHMLAECQAKLSIYEM